MDSVRLSSLWFTRLFAGAVLAHIAGNRPFELDARGIATLLLGLTAAVVLLEPGQRTLRIAMNVLVLATVWLEAPFIGNHWLVVGFVSLAMLVSELRGFWWLSFRPTAQGILLVFYSFAAFAKLNAGFFDPVVSCGLFYANQSLSSWGLPQVASGGALPIVVAAGTTLIELAVPVLLVIKRTRPYGVMLGFAFHYLISLDLGQHFYDFTAVLLALFSLFLADEVLERFEGMARRYRAVVVAVAASSVVLTVASVLPPRPSTVWIVQRASFIVWIPVGAVLVLAVLRHATPDRGPLVVLSAGPVGFALIALILFNGLTPYLGIKTSTSFNMYANLRTTEGESNHWVIRETAEAVDINYVEVLETDDRGLSYYIDSGYRVPERNLLDYLADHPGATVTYRLGDETITGDGATLGEPMPLLVEKFGLFRSIDSQDPPRCQALWLPAY